MTNSDRTTIDEENLAKHDWRGEDWWDPKCPDCRPFPFGSDREATQPAAQTMAKHFRLLDFAKVERPFSDDGELRELTVRFGNSRYLALYRHDADADAASILAFRHEREAGY